MNENEDPGTVVEAEAVNETEAAEPLANSTDDRMALEAEIERLRGEVARLGELQARSRGELDEFCLLFPSVPLSSLPGEVREAVDGGVPLAAAYALYEKREAHRAASGQRSAESSWRGMNESGGGEYYSPSEVREMSQKEVHKNYKKIMESMKHWK
ncbi:MAG: hypothetical protein J6D16_06100 [Clostridia bacterium]|nr:hypothetical protein [Clostridia bacterium]